MAGVQSSFSVAAQAAEAVSELVAQLRAGARGGKVAGGFIQSSVTHDLAAVATALQVALPGVPFVGVTSCQGLGSDRGLAPAGPGLSALWLIGDDVQFQVAATRRPEVTGAGAALVSGLAPRTAGNRFALFHATPGNEERLLSELVPALGSAIPLLGGTAADDDLSGKWGVFASGGFSTGTGAVVAVVDWPGRVSASMQSTAMVTPQRGLVTRASGRTLFEIDGRPAAQVYNQWIGGGLGRQLRDGGNILNDTTLQPLGVHRVERGIGSYVLIHPESMVAETGAMTTFKEIHVGEEVWLMKASRAGFIGRPASVVERLMIDTRLPASQVLGAYLVYCAGCRLTVDDGTSLMLAGFRGAVGHVPFITAYFFGEQGCSVPNGPAEHGNLMTGALLLGT
ncbi:MAG: FIST N-terminal domain-containing protein [Archangium sp.]|nr:FIST N-terminal domain-containing protein [Archangium sp.]